MGIVTLNGKQYELNDKKQCNDYWTDYAKSKLLGKKIVGVHYMSDKECKALGWSNSTIVIQLDDGTIIYPSMDDEGNNGGALFGQNGKEDLTFPVL